MEDFACECGGCNQIYIDENPQTGAIKIEIPDKSDILVWNDDEFAWVCPVCNTDEYLMDLPKD